MRKIDILAQWIRDNPPNTPAPYNEIREQAIAALGPGYVGPNTLPTVLRDLGYQRQPTRYNIWYLQPGQTMPSTREQAHRYYSYPPRT